MEKIKIIKAKDSNYQHIIDLLKENNLPTQGVKSILKNTYIAMDEDIIIGCAAIEVYSKAALLRSVAVSNKYRGKGIGLELTKKSIDLSKNKNIKEIFLLTETAENYFTKLDFTQITRNEAPKEIQQSKEFSIICPQSASVLKLDIK